MPQKKYKSFKGYWPTAGEIFQLDNDSSMLVVEAERGSWYKVAEGTIYKTWPLKGYQLKDGRAICEVVRLNRDIEKVEDVK